MKRTFTFLVCLLVLHIANAAPGAGTTPQKIDSAYAHAANQLQLTGYAGMMKQRLDSIQKDVPLVYNEYVQSYIDNYANRRDEMGHIIGLSKYYFPIYEKAFREAGIPEEIKYLSVVESELNPNAVSRVGATGPWQFMFTTAKIYGLTMDDYVDDRRDPVRASYAAAAYLRDAYQEFGDWLLAIASYNCGKSSVESAIQKAGVNDYWAIRAYLPQETRGYVPAYIAVAYVMNYYNKHHITPESCRFSMKNDTVMVDKYISLNSISGSLNIDINQLALLNPSYKRMIINGSPSHKCRLIVPQAPNGQYAALYTALNNATVAAAPPQPMTVTYKSDSETEHRPAYHKVRRGETLADIADRYGVDVDDLKTWNHLSHKTHLQPGMTLKISHG